MKLVKSLALGSAAAFVMTANAQAADLPGAEPVEYVKICDIKGSTGFFYIPGTETCLQVGGFARLEMTSGEVVQDNNNPLTDKSDVANRTGYRVRARVWFDARTDTEYGAVRTFVRLQFQRETGAVGRPTTTNSNSAGDDAFFDQAFVQFAGLTAGVTDSFWDFKPYPTFQNPFISDRTLPALAYTAKFGDVSASVALEDAPSRYRDGFPNFSNVTVVTGVGAIDPVTGLPIVTTGTAINNSYANSNVNAGQSIPDIVANVRVKQGWGEAQISGIVHKIDPKKSFADTFSGGINGGSEEYGYGGQAGFKLNLPTANTSDNKGDFVWGQAGYVDGAGLSYLGVGDQNIGSGTTQNITTFNLSRDYLLVNGQTEKTKGFNANLGVLHYWSPKWRSALQATYISVDYRKVDADWTAGAVTTNLIWTPIKKLDIGAELVYVKNLSRSGTGGLAGATTVYTGNRKDDDAFVGRLRVQRDF